MSKNKKSDERLLKIALVTALIGAIEKLINLIIELIKLLRGI